MVLYTLVKRSISLHEPVDQALETFGHFGSNEPHIRRGHAPSNPVRASW